MVAVLQMVNKKDGQDFTEQVRSPSSFAAPPSRVMYVVVLCTSFGAQWRPPEVFHNKGTGVPQFGYRCRLSGGVLILLCSCSLQPHSRVAPLFFCTARACYTCPRKKKKQKHCLQEVPPLFESCGEHISR